MKHVVVSRRSREIPAAIFCFDAMRARWFLEGGRPATLEVGLATTPGKQYNFKVSAAATERNHIENDHN